MILLHELLQFIQDNKPGAYFFLSYFLSLFIIFVDLTKFVIMKTKSTVFYKAEGDSMQLAVIDLIFDVIHCVISEV
ncbi:hypothetical protein NSMM_190015 [Nitrosomonas mobilis]|uniref:Uncharacterized protein n=1 Tax=Nitrosomonas mobilis TaxID=51642 RepID=A0A1G5SBL8_9PROT|nr:hypothetical protein NSMM_190015 [Nitrosomonas mobilis]